MENKLDSTATTFTSNYINRYDRYNREKLQWLFDNGLIRLKYDSLFEEPPEPMQPGFTFDRIAGMLLGLALQRFSSACVPSV